MSASRSATTVTPGLRRGRLSWQTPAPTSPAVRCLSSAPTRALPAGGGDVASDLSRHGSRHRPLPGRGTTRSWRPPQPSHVPAHRTRCPSQPGRVRGGAARWLGTSPRKYLDGQDVPPRAGLAGSSDQPSISFATVTFGLAKNRPARSSPPRLPPRRRKHTVLSMAICSRIAPPFIEAQISECPERHFHGGPCSSVAAGRESYRRRVGQAESQGRSEIDITCVHVLVSEQRH